LLFYTYAPPPFEEDIIMTTTIIIAAKDAITLYTLFFNIKSVCIANIHPPTEKTKPYPDLSLKGKAICSQPSLFEKVSLTQNFLFRQFVFSDQ
jgi:hypothetical protein